MKTEMLITVAPLAAILLVGCSHRGQVAAKAPMTHHMTPASGSVSQQRRAAPDVDEAAEPEAVEVMTTGVALEPSLAEACGVSLPEAFFEFDSSKLEPQAPKTLDLFVNCLSSGPLQGTDIKLVGRTDPRGSDAYNMKLGMSRAEAVAGYLERHGIDAGTITVDSDGKTGALDIRQAYPYERRVDIRRAEPEEEETAEISSVEVEP